MSRTRIKICGLSRPEEVKAAVDGGADAIGLVFFPPSPRYVSADQAARLVAAVPPFVSTVGLFVNATEEQVAQVVAQVPLSMLQFHGDENPDQCAAIAAAVNRPFVRAVRVHSALTHADLIKYELDYRNAAAAHAAQFAGLLLDAFVEGYGGGGKVFDWSLIPKELAPRVVLSGGLSAQNVAEAVARVRPYAVDVSSGVEQAKGVKDIPSIHAFISAVRRADAEA